MEFLKQIKLYAILAIVVAGAAVSCKKEDPIVFEEEPSVTAPTFTPISGTTWTDINPSATYRVNALATVNNKLFISRTWSGGISALYDGNTWHWCGQGFSSFGSGSGIEKMTYTDGHWYGTGSMGGYGVFEFDTANESYPWSSAAYPLTNTYAVARYNGELYYSCGVAPFIRNTSGTSLGDNLDGAVYDLVVYNGELIAAGSFSNSGATAVSKVAKWNGTEWLPLATGLSGTVRDLEVYNGKLVAVGNFTQNGDGNTACRYAAMWDGTSWLPFGSGISGGLNGAFVALTNGSELIIGGQFDGGGGVSSPNLIKWDGSAFKAIASGAPDIIGQMTIWNGKLYVANQFLISNGNFLLRLD